MHPGSRADKMATEALTSRDLAGVPTYREDELELSKRSAGCEACSESPNTAMERRMVASARKGDERAFSRLVNAYQDRVYGICLRMLGHNDEAEDVAQEVFVALHKGLSTFRGDARLSTWVFRVTRNQCLNRLKYLERRHRNAHVCRDIETEDASEPALMARSLPTPEQQVVGFQLQEILERALLDLPGDQRLLVILRDIDGLTYDEIVEISELPLGTVKSRLHRARLSLAATVRGFSGDTSIEENANRSAPVSGPPTSMGRDGEAATKLPGSKAKGEEE